jgi:Domain of unknown function (DUF4402)
MKKTLIGAAIVAAVTFTHAASAQNTASASFSVGAHIVSPLSIVKVTDMNFGDVVPSVAGGSVVLSTAGVATPAGVNLGNGGAARTAATFTVSGQSGYTYAITLPGSSTISDGATHTMSVGSFTSNPSGTGALVSGTQALALGATLTVGPNQTPGVYSGSFNVTVTYN